MKIMPVIEGKVAAGNNICRTVGTEQKKTVKIHIEYCFLTMFFDHMVIV
jgi:hypothetical protein